MGKNLHEIITAADDAVSAAIEEIGKKTAVRVKKEITEHKEGKSFLPSLQKVFELLSKLKKERNSDIQIKGPVSLVSDKRAIPRHTRERLMQADITVFQDKDGRYLESQDPKEVDWKKAYKVCEGLRSQRLVIKLPTITGFSTGNKSLYKVECIENPKFRRDTKSPDDEGRYFVRFSRVTSGNKQDRLMKRMGVSTTFYNSANPDEMKSLLTDIAKVVIANKKLRDMCPL